MVERGERGPGTGPRFYGRRRGHRLRPQRQSLMDAVLPRVAIVLPPGAGTIDTRTLFDPLPTQVWLEIGFGGGEHLANQAAAHPDIGFIGCEPFINGVASLMRHVDEENLGNVRVWPEDARLLLPRLPDASIDRAFVLFPDPWPKRRHHSRRILGAAGLAELARLLTDGGELRIATDHPGYRDWILMQLGRTDAFTWTARGPADWRERPADWPPTRYEEKALGRGAACTYLRWCRRRRSA